jgi:hypothetical protein
VEDELKNDITTVRNCRYSLSRILPKDWMKHDLGIICDLTLKDLETRLKMYRLTFGKDE